MRGHQLRLDAWLKRRRCCSTDRFPQRYSLPKQPLCTPHASSDLRILCRLAAPVKVFVDIRSEEASEPNFQRFECKTQEGLHDFLLRQGASGLTRADVMDAPVCHDAGDLEAGCRYDLVFGRGSEWAKMRGGLGTLNGVADEIALIHEEDVSPAPQPPLGRSPRAVTPPDDSRPIPAVTAVCSGRRRRRHSRRR